MMFFFRRRSIPIYLRCRYVFDFIVALLIFILALPVMLIVSLLISLDGGSIIFWQARVGVSGKEFKVYKFRSMVENADDYLTESGRVIGNRVTLVGKIIRKTSIDEMPQLVNILRGEMAIIGPRPILPKMLAYMSDSEKRRFDALPGITGLAQVNGRNNVKWSERFAMDVKYIDNVGLALDIKIAIKTIAMVLTSADISSDRNAEKVDDVTSRKISS